MATSSKVTIRHGDGREYIVEEKAFDRLYKPQGFKIVSYADGRPHPDGMTVQEASDHLAAQDEAGVRDFIADEGARQDRAGVRAAGEKRLKELGVGADGTRYVGGSFTTGTSSEGVESGEAEG